MGRYMDEIGLTPAARSRIVVQGTPQTAEPPVIIRRIIISAAGDEDMMLDEGDDAKGVITLSPDATRL